MIGQPLLHILVGSTIPASSKRVNMVANQLINETTKVSCSRDGSPCFTTPQNGFKNTYNEKEGNFLYTFKQPQKRKKWKQTIRGMVNRTLCFFPWDMLKGTYKKYTIFLVAIKETVEPIKYSVKGFG